MNTRLLLMTAALTAMTPLTALAGPFYFTPNTVEQRYVAGLGAVSGSRDAGFFGRHGEEALGSLDLRVSDDLVVTARAGIVHNRIDDETESNYAAELRYLGLGGGWSLGLGYRNDYDKVSIPFAHVAWTQPDTGYPFAVSAVVEMPQRREQADGDTRDSADVIIGLGKAFACGARLQCALELAGEDLEGFIDTTEAEGGAKFLLGPTLSFAMTGEQRLKLFAGWIHAATTNEPTRSDYVDYRGHRDGAMLRLTAEFGR